MTTSKSSLPVRLSNPSVNRRRNSRARSPPVTPRPSLGCERNCQMLKLPLTQRNAQLVLAREYGFAGWPDLTAEVSKRLGSGLEWAAAQADASFTTTTSNA